MASQGTLCLPAAPTQPCCTTTRARSSTMRWEPCVLLNKSRPEPWRRFEKKKKEKKEKKCSQGMAQWGVAKSPYGPISNRLGFSETPFLPTSSRSAVVPSLAHTRVYLPPHASIPLISWWKSPQRTLSLFTFRQDFLSLCIQSLGSEKCYIIFTSTHFFFLNNNHMSLMHNDHPVNTI